MINSKISSGAIIQQLLSNFNVQIEKNDAIEWIADCMELIGYHTGFVNKYELMPVNDYTIEKPVDFQSLNYVMTREGKIMHHGKLKGNTGNVPRVQGDFTSDIYGLIEAKKHLQELDLTEFIRIVDTKTVIDIPTRKNYEQALDKKILDRLAITVPNSSRYCDYYYYDAESCWKTNYEDNVVLFYKAFPFDDKGYPMVVDEINYKMAVRWYLLKCLMDNGYTHPVLKYEFVYTETNKFIHKASNYGAKFDRNQKESFIRMWSTGYQSRRSYYEN